MLSSSTKNSTLVAHLLVVAALFLLKIDGIIVQFGDTLLRIADEQGVSLAALEAANPKISVNDLLPGQVLSIPASNAATSKPTSAVTTLIKSTSAKSTSSSTSSSSSTSFSSSSSSYSTPPAPPPTTTSIPTFTADLTSVPSASCAPKPAGSFSSAADIDMKTDKFCDDNGHHTLATLARKPNYGKLIGNEQSGNTDNGSGGVTSNEVGYNMTISAVPGCVYPDTGDLFTVGVPMGKKAPPAWDCRTVLTNCYYECNNEGMGGQIQAGCFLYLFEPDP